MLRLTLSYRRIITWMLVCLVAAPSAAAAAGDPETLRVYAAASLKDAIGELSQRYEADRDVAIKAIHAGSGTLARQIAHGAPADIFIPAHPQWLDWLANQGLHFEQRGAIAANRLVLIAPRDTPAGGAGVKKRLATLAEGGERVAIGHPAYVPAGIYARQALKALGHWQALRSRLVRAANARATVAMVARGGIAAGLVYRTDARVSDRVRALGLLPADTHDPIQYPAVVLEPVSEPAKAFRAWLESPAARTVLADHGFHTGS